jgi:hypothetical protein
MKKLFYYALSLALLFPVSAKAQADCDDKLGSDINIGSLFQAKYCSPNEFILAALRFLFTIAGLAAVLFIVWGGIQYIISGANPDLAKKARTNITNALLGLVIILLAYTLVAVLQYTISNL